MRVRLAIVPVLLGGCDFVFPVGSGGGATDGRPVDASTGRYCPTDEVSLGGYWRLGEPVGAATAVDSSGNGRDGTYTGEVALGIDGALGDDDTAADFSEADLGFVTLGDTYGFEGIAPFSVEAWIQPLALAGTGYRHIVTKQHRFGPKQGWALLINNVGFAYLERHVSDTAGALSPMGLVGATGFTHVVGTYDGATQRLYLDGVEVGTGTPDVGSLPASPGTPALIGSGDVTLDANFGGTLDEVAIYGAALSLDAVMQHFAAAQTGSCLGMN